MRRITFILVLMLCSCLQSFGQSSANDAKALASQGQSYLRQGNYVQARSSFIQVYQAFASQGAYAQAIHYAVKANNTNLIQHRYKEAFALCRDMDQFISSIEKKEHRSFSGLRFYVTKNRVQLYMSLHKPESAKGQLAQLAELSNSAKTDSIDEDFLYTKATFCYSFGMNAKGDEAMQQVISKYKSRKQYDKVTSCYRTLISIARKSNNAALMGKAYENLMSWTEKVKVLTANDELNNLKRKYADSQETIKKKDHSLTAKNIFIGILIVIAVALGIVLAGGAGMLMKYMAGNRKLKKNIAIANEHNELKTKFIKNISSQMEPTLDRLDNTADLLKSKAGDEAKKIQVQVASLKQFSNDIQELSSLESSLDDIYDMKEFNVATFCENLIEQCKPSVKPAVSITCEAPRLQIPGNKEQLTRILLHLLQNAALYTSEGHIRLEFKKRGAHAHEFIVTDTGSGIATEQQDNLFKPFAEVRDLTEGDGLGLPICSLIAAKMNGNLILDKTYKKGSRFILELHA